MQVPRRRLWPRLRADAQARGSLGGLERATPLPVPAVENKDAVAIPQAEHVAEIVRLGALERDRCPAVERRVDEKPGTAEIVAGHGGPILGPE